MSKRKNISKYSCNENTCQCVDDDDGEFESFTECKDKCENVNGYQRFSGMNWVFSNPKDVVIDTFKNIHRLIELTNLKNLVFMKYEPRTPSIAINIPQSVVSIQFKKCFDHEPSRSLDNYFPMLVPSNINQLDCEHYSDLHILNRDLVTIEHLTCKSDLISIGNVFVTDSLTLTVQPGDDLPKMPNVKYLDLTTSEPFTDLSGYSNLRRITYRGDGRLLNIPESIREINIYNPKYVHPIDVRRLKNLTMLRVDRCLEFNSRLKFHKNAFSESGGILQLPVNYDSTITLTDDQISNISSNATGSVQVQGNEERCLQDTLTKSVNCDKLEGAITFDTIGQGNGVCWRKRCYDKNSLQNTFKMGQVLPYDPPSKDELELLDLINQFD